MKKKYFIRGYREDADFPSLCDEEMYSLEEAMNKSREYFRKIKALDKIVLVEQKETKEKKAARITIMNKVKDLKDVVDWWDNF
jgi:hypothetical protein